MSDFNPHDFDKILNNIKHKISTFVECDTVKPIESNLNTKSMMFKPINNIKKDGMIIVGEDKGSIAVDISGADNAVRSFILRNQYDIDGINNIIIWFKENYALKESLIK
ncbi:hypothetical protein [Clostridium pasteurianum]|uniref:Uncharacterized protein n=1 Tax=Clostridium pasteurianum BC1 TaxID=86416 RepID=R4KD31_CLOPA|nr:hypothetical protein [Clostridium pasteurianum]AGK97500.1 hypothetical protein Clopa_2644 [Clostridium pasteurianum BC1]